MNRKIGMAGSLITCLSVAIFAVTMLVRIFYPHLYFVLPPF